MHPRKDRCGAIRLERIKVEPETTQQLLGNRSQRKERCLLRFPVPRKGCGDAGYGDRQAELLGISLQRLFRCSGRRIVKVAVAELVQLQVAVAVIGVQLHGFEHIEQQRLSHDVQVVAERIEYLHAMLRLV